ncbi:flagellar hook capping FlgD N-terminal domain-containing protein [Parendozoicomonas haliclonae]|uniref:Basal-body rod modification protein FlgD n=1 Tax=Parendozoicomonas haliclonae TaxID=1960125 RepID=A0A1X7AP57_9GAMM|nr:flagellar hook capping FlgD N-terminal domain-containing protein [Parendozoicomonas haliclonae]SMA49888.1 flagellar basal body rod modification protein [Parendozoicomonas haliclonae]
MAIDAVGQVAGTQLATQQSSLSLDEFLDVFITQLNYQDPLDPVDNKEFLAQMAQFSSLEIARNSQNHLEDALEISAVSQTVGLLGKTVEVNGEKGISIGKVTSIRLANGSPVFSVSTADNTVIADLRPSQITLVRE